MNYDYYVFIKQLEQDKIKVLLATLLNKTYKQLGALR